MEEDIIIKPLEEDDEKRMEYLQFIFFNEEWNNK